MADRIATPALARLALLARIVAAKGLDRDVRLRGLGGIRGMLARLDGELRSGSLHRRIRRCVGEGFGSLRGRGLENICRCRSFGRLDERGAVKPLAGNRRGLGLRFGSGGLVVAGFGRGGFGRGLGRCRVAGGGVGEGLVRRVAILRRRDGLFALVLGRLLRGRLLDRFGALLGASVLDIRAVDAVVTPPRLVVVVRLGVQALLLGDQPFAVGDGDLIVVGVDFGKGQEAVAVAAIFDERRLKRRFDANDLGEVDIALEGLAAGGFEIEFFKSCSIDDDDPCFFRVTRINEHTPCHGLAPEAFDPNRREQPAAKPPLWREGDGAPSTRRTAQLGPRRGSIAPPDRNRVLPTSVFLIATACLTILWRTRRARFC